MIVFIVIRRKQKKDRRLREQFLQVPAPEGIGFKSSRYDCYLQGNPYLIPHQECGENGTFLGACFKEHIKAFEEL